MENYELTTTDFEELKKIIKTTSSIYNLYQKMYVLESKGQKESEEYQKLIEYLKIALEVEEVGYLDLNLTYQKCLALIRYLEINYQLPNDLDYIPNLDDKNLIFMRIRNILDRKMLSFTENLKNTVVPQEIRDILQRIGIINEEKLSQSIYSNTELNKALKFDLISSYLIFLKNTTRNKDYSQYKDELLKAMYQTIFIYKDIENEILKNNFNVPDNINITSQFVADLFQINIAYPILKNLFAGEICQTQINEIIEIKDIDYDNPKIYVASILRQCLLKSSFLLLDDNHLENINYQFHSFIESDQYISRHQGDRISEEAISRCFRNIKKDKAKTITLSFKYADDTKKN